MEHAAALREWIKTELKVKLMHVKIAGFANVIQGYWES